MENVAQVAIFAVIVMGIAIAFLAFALIKSKKKLEIERLNSDILNLKNENERLNSDILNLKNENERLNSGILNLKNENERLNSDILNLKNEIERLNNILTNHKNSIPIILKMRKDTSDLLFFYRKVIHTMPYLNPIHRNTAEFINSINNINNIGEESKSKEIVNIFSQSFGKINFPDLENDFTDFREMIFAMLYTPFNEVSEKLPDIYTPKQKKSLEQKLEKSITNAIASVKDDLDSIGVLYQLLADRNTFARWQKLMSRSAGVEFIKNFVRGVVQAALDTVTFGAASTVGNILSTVKGLDDNEFISFYQRTIDDFIKAPDELARKMDIGFAAIEALYQKHQEEVYSLLQEKQQMSLVVGDDIQDLYSTWRNTQANEVLREIPGFVEKTIEELRKEGLDRETINNIREMI
ncbi:MAG: hypothetical protein LBU89_04130 [Fibromonadaceae bacterium]|jgi:hypothetical protein|nr:hypothetical protein [Fibromonadaceae bacterium]